MSDKREFERFPIARLAFASSVETGETYGGILRNVSGGGALIELASPLHDVNNVFQSGMAVNITIDEFSPIKGKVILTDGINFSVSFDADTVVQAHLLEEIFAAMENEPRRSAT